MPAKIFLIVLCILFCLTPILGQDPKAGAEKLFAEAEELFNKNTPEARREAVKKYLESLALWEKLDDTKNQAETLNRLAEISYLNTEIQGALDYSQKSLPLFQKLGNRAMEAETLSNMGSFYDILGETRTGLTYAEKSIPILREIGDKKREAIALSGLGVLYSNVGEMQTALDVLQRSLILRREVKDRIGEARTLSNLGAIFDDTGEKRKAVEFYEQAIVILEEEKDTRTLAVALNNLGFALRELGEYQKALDIYRQALELRRQSGDKRGEATSINNIGATYRILGEYEEALKLVEQALQIYQKGGFKRNEAVSLSSIATLYDLLGDEQKRLECLEKALNIHRSIGNKSGEAAVLQDIGSFNAEKNQPQKALEFFREALRLAEEVKERERIARISLGMAQTYERLNDATSAEANYNRALSLHREIELREEIAETLYHFAKFDERNGRRTAAIEKMQEVLRLLEDLRNSIAVGSLRSSYFAEQQKFFDFYIYLLASQHKLEPKKGFDALALQISEQARARGLLESLGESQLDVRGGIATELLNKERLLRQIINAKETQRLTAVRQKNPAKATEFEKEIGDIIRQYRDLQTEIRAKSPQFAALTQPEPINLKEIQSQILDENTVLLEYFLGAERSFLFFATKGALEIYELPKQAEIEISARNFVANLKARSAENSQETLAERQKRLQIADENRKQSGRKLSEILLSPIAGKIQNKRLLIVSSGVLQYIPFSALSFVIRPSSVEGNIKASNKGQRTNDKEQFLIETNEVAHLPSASTLAVLRKAKNNRQEKSEAKNLVAVLADPVFGGDDIRLKEALKKPAEKSAPVALTSTNETEARVLPTQLRSGFSRLRFSRQEAEAISGLVPDEREFIALDFAANTQAVSSEKFTNSRIVHFATHGVINSNFPELSGVVLSLIDENGKQRDGFLRLHEVYNLSLNADLIVLSACETALGKEIKGEGLVGLTRGFMYAGSRSVVASLWKVDDRATAELMRRFYQKMLKENLRPADALRKAQVSLIAEKQTQNPFFWAAFTLQGEYR